MRPGRGEGESEIPTVGEVCRAIIEEIFGHHGSRFHTIDLSDRILRATIPHRVVVTRTRRPLAARGRFRGHVAQRPGPARAAPTEPTRRQLKAEILLALQT